MTDRPKYMSATAGRTSDESVVGRDPPSPLEQAAYDWGQQAVKDRLPNTRALAEKWGTTVSALTALFGTGTILSSDTVVRSLVSPWGVRYGIAACLALILSAAAIWCASRAAQATVGDIGPGAAERLVLYEKRLKNSVRSLHISRWCAGIAVLFLLASLAIRWYAPVTPPPAP